MTIAIGGHGKGNSTPFGSSTSVTTAATGTSASGSKFLIFVNAKSKAISSVSDSFSNTYTLKATSTGFNKISVYLCESGSGGASHTATVNMAAADSLVVFFVEVVGAATTSFDVIASGSDTSGSNSSLNGAAVTTTNAPDLILSCIGAFGDTTSVTDSGSGFTLVDTITTSGTLTSALSWSRRTSTGSFNDSYTFGSTNFFAFATIALMEGAAPAALGNSLIRTPGPGPGYPFNPFLMLGRTGSTVVVANPNVTVSLTGQAATFTPGILSPNTSIALTGQAGTFAPGSLIPVTSVTLTGQAATFARGLLLPNTSVGLTGQSATFAGGIMSTGSDVTVALTGQAATFTGGVLAPSTTIALTGGAASFAAGNLIATPTLALTGGAITATAGTLSPSTSVAVAGLSASFTAGLLGVAGDVTVALTGLSATFAGGQLTAQGGDQPVVPVGGSNAGGGGGGGSGKFEFRVRKIEEAVRKQLAPKPRRAPVVLASTLAHALSSAPAKVSTEEDDLKAISLLLDDERTQVLNYISLVMKGLDA